MDFGIWHDFRNPPQWHVPYSRLYAENLEQIAWAETLGYESVWVSEHHLTDDGYLPSVFPMLAAIAERTTTMRLGSAILLAPFQHPVRFAEDVAVLDQLSSGRLEVGLGLGYRQLEFDELGVPIAERARRTEELIEVARSVWADGSAAPPPFQQPEPPFWIGGTVDAAARRAARLGAHFMPDAYVARDVLALYRSLMPGGRVSINPTVYVGDWDDVSEHLLYQFNRYREWGGGQPITSADELPRERYIVGSADEVTAGVQALVDRTACDRLFFWARPPGLSIELANRSLERFAREVMPRIRDVDDEVV
jgi:alkanesulfonate monooxygenase SsuD/methylene tetrahydromethanopterin reductase-like flavin-dependent oxidoreductase (luciferase family)